MKLPLERRVSKESVLRLIYRGLERVVRQISSITCEVAMQCRIGGLQVFVPLSLEDVLDGVRFFNESDDPHMHLGHPSQLSPSRGLQLD